MAVCTSVKYGVWGWNPHAGAPPPVPPVFYRDENRYKNGIREMLEQRNCSMSGFRHASATMAHRVLQAEAILHTFPKPPLLSSQQAAWDSIYLEYHHQPAYETPECCFSWHIITVHLGRPTLLEAWTDAGRIARTQVIAGDVGIYPAEVGHWERSYQETEFIDLHLDFNRLSQVVQDGINSDRLELVPRIAIRDPLIHQIGLALKAELETGGDVLYAESMTNALAIHLLRHYTGQPHHLTNPRGSLSRQKLQLAIDYIHDHLDQGLSVKAIAATVQLSPHHFSRLFKQSTGLAPHQYVLQCRVEHAKQLLLKGNLAIAQVAYQAGFTSQSHLNRHFKRLLGVTPGELLRQ